MIDGVFLGRRDELARFAALLGELSADRQARFLGRRSRGSGKDLADAGRSRVVVVHGLGGSGKSRLLRQFREMADGRLPGLPAPLGQARTVWLDWEDEQRDNPASYAGADGPSLVTVLDAMQKAVIDASAADAKTAERVGHTFNDYRQGAARMPQYAALFTDVIAQSRQAGSPFTSGDAAALTKSLASVGLLGAGHPGGVLGLTGDQLAVSAQAAVHLSEAAARAVTGKKAGEISPKEYDLVTEPARELTRRVATAMHTVAERVPLVVFLDTGEVLGGGAWGWLRRVMAHTGPRVIWVVGARFETEAEAGVDSPVAQFVRDIGDARLVLMSPTRFDDGMIGEYLHSRTGNRDYTSAEIDLIAQFTRGLPLAVSFTAELLEQGQQVEDVCRELDDGLPSSVVSRLARRYLVHAEERTYPPEDPRRDDLTRILGLALALGDLRRDPDLLAALWDVTDPLTAFQDLAHRHDFVLPISRRLHDDVREALRTDLLDPWRRARVRGINQRGLDMYSTRLGEMRVKWPTLDQQLDHPGFTTALLAALWHTLWVDNQAGLDFVAEILPVLLVVDPVTASATVASMLGEFAGTFDQDQRRDLDRLIVRSKTVLLSKPLPMLLDDSIARWLESRMRPAPMANHTHVGVAGHTGSLAKASLLGEPGDWQAAVKFLLARLQLRDHDYEGAIAGLQMAATQTGSSRLRQFIGTWAESIANKLIWSGPDRTATSTSIGLEAAKLATETLTDSVSAWQSYAAALDEVGRLEDALAAHDRALALGPGYAAAHSNRGNTLLDLGRFEDALAAQDQALAIDPDLAGTHVNRGIALLHMGRSEEALAALDQALTLDPDHIGCHQNRGIVLAVMGRLDDALAELDTVDLLEPDRGGEGRTWAGAILWHRGDTAGAQNRFARVVGRATWCPPFHTAEMEAVALCGLGQADDAEQRLLSALPRRVPGDRAEPRALYDLLSDPPLPGIDRLRTIVDSDA